MTDQAARPEGSDSSEELGPVAEVKCGRLQWTIPRDDYRLPLRFLNNDTHPLYDRAALDAAVAAERERLRSALEWYAAEARACAKNSHTGNHAAPQALLASVTVLALDGGRRADEALKA